VTLRHVLGLRPDTGHRSRGEDITDFPKREFFRVRKKFGLLFQSGALFDSMSVFENTPRPRAHRDGRGGDCAFVHEKPEP
jgi:phospholipid/cholesterol/gamma-HCH transport system ATP-binding protein